MIKKHLLLTLLVELSIIAAFAQPQTKLVKRDTTIYTSVEQSAEYPGGMGKLYDYVTKRVKVLPTDTLLNYKLIVSFIVEKDGNLSTFKVIRSISPKFDEQFISVIKAAGKWIPGKNDGKVVRQQYLIPISINPGEN